MTSIHRPSRRRPGIEPLEERAVPAATFLKDINLATANGVTPGSNFANLNGTVYFAADNGVHGIELWKSNGTAAGTAMVKDINTSRITTQGSPSPLPSSNPSRFTIVNNVVYFVADDGVHGQELWKTDGTAGGTKLVKDILPPQTVGGAHPLPNPAIDNLTAYKGAVFFTTTSPEGTSLWKSYGTPGSTVVVRTFQPGSYPTALVGKPVLFQNKLYFAANDGSDGVELWSSDGTTNDTKLVKDISEYGDSFPSDLTVFKGRLYFSSNDGMNGAELWSSDGTAAGTRMLKDINTTPSPAYIGGAASSSPHEFTVVNGTLYFAANDGVFGDELWKTNGTAAGTVLVKDVYPGDSTGGVILPGLPVSPYPISSAIQEMTAFNGQLYFVAMDGVHGLELWKSDGTAAGTKLVKDINTRTGPGPMPLEPSLPFGANIRQLTVAGNKLFFVADDGSHGAELWKSDGTAAGTTMVKDIRSSLPGGPDLGGSYPEHLIAVGVSVFFSAYDDLHGMELWKSDGTAAGTTMVKDVNRNTQGSSPQELTTVGGVTFFVATDTTSGMELWKTNGTPAGTTLVKDLLPGLESSAPQHLINFNGTLYFAARDKTGNHGLYRSNGTAAGTTLVRSFAQAVAEPGGAIVYLDNLTVFAGKLYFTVHGNRIADLWRTDGTANGTVRMYRFPATSPFGIPQLGNLTVAGKYLYFAAQQPNSGLELWRTDGRDTRIVRDLNRGPGNSTPAHLIAVGDKLFFTADDGTRGMELWQTEGTPGGTRLVKDINPGTNSAFYAQSMVGFPEDPFVVIGRTVYFTADDGVHGAELWKSDGTAAGTVLVKDVNTTHDIAWPEGPKGSNPTELTVYNGAVYFRADDGVNGSELWKSDGTARGTVLVKDIWAGSTEPVLPPPLPVQSQSTKIPNSSYPTSFHVYQGRLYFTATEGTSGNALWSTDGTTAGTRLAAKISPAPPPGGGPYWWATAGRILGSANGRLYLVGTDLAHGAELWTYT